MKDITIRKFLKTNAKFFIESEIDIVDYGVDLCAISLKKNQKEIYICTISYHNSDIKKKENKNYFDIDLELIIKNEPQIIETYKNLTDSDVINLAKSFLG